MKPRSPHGGPEVPPEPTQAWMQDARIKTYRRGQTIIEAGSELGDVIGWNSPLGKLAARYEVNALVDVVTISIPRTQLSRSPDSHERGDTALLHAATEARLQDQITMRLAGNGFQRLVSVLATLATALAPPLAPGPVLIRLPLPVAQAFVGQLSGLSRRQTWIYLGQLAEAGWVSTTRTKVMLEGLPSWLALMTEVEREGLACIATVELCGATLTRLGEPQGG